MDARARFARPRPLRAGRSVRTLGAGARYDRGIFGSRRLRAYRQKSPVARTLTRPTCSRRSPPSALIGLRPALATLAPASSLFIGSRPHNPQQAKPIGKYRCAWALPSLNPRFALRSVASVVACSSGGLRAFARARRPRACACRSPLRLAIHSFACMPPSCACRIVPTLIVAGRSGLLFAFFARVPLVGVLRPSLGRAITHAPSSLSLRSAGRLEPFLSACALICGHGYKRFPYGAVAHSLPAFRHSRLLARSRHYLSARAYRPAIAGALPP